MVIQCFVPGCNKTQFNSNLRFFILPKNAERAKQWIEAAGLPMPTSESLNSQSLRQRYRFCSRHFLPTSIRNQRLADDAVPRLNLPGQDEVTNHSVLCNICGLLIDGYRYKCITCEDYDLCQTCEKSDDHGDHFIVRIPKPMEPVDADKMMKKFKSVLSSNEPGKTGTVKSQLENDSDDEPITKYQNSDTFELSDEDKRKISKEVDRVLKLISKKRKGSTTENTPRKKDKKITNCTQTEFATESESMAEVEFADVNLFKVEKTAGTITLSDGEEEVKPEVGLLYNQFI